MKRTIFISLIFIALCSCNKEEIYADAGYAIGTINSYTSVMGVLTYHYDFKVENKTYKGDKKGGISNSGYETRMIGRQYLVVYKRTDPNKSDLNFGYPITDEQQFNDLVEGFKDDPPKK